MTKKANSVMYLIKRAFSCLPPALLVKLYKTYLRPIIEYGFQIWNPYFEKDIQLVERVQRKFTKSAAGLSNLSYEERLDALNLTTLADRRRRGDLIETYKILNDYYDCPVLHTMFHLNRNTYLRGHTLKLDKYNFRMNPKKNFLSNRVVNDWNGLPQCLVVADSVNGFKNGLDKVL